jgi:fibronectin type 3 domain-containing protein
VQHSVNLFWDASSSSVTGYNVYRGGQSGSPYSKINDTPVAGTTYTDSSVQAGQTYYYVTTSVGTDGTESSYSNQGMAVIPTP